MVFGIRILPVIQSKKYLNNSSGGHEYISDPCFCIIEFLQKFELFFIHPTTLKRVKKESPCLDSLFKTLTVARTRFFFCFYFTGILFA